MTVEGEQTQAIGLALRQDLTSLWGWVWDSALLGMGRWVMAGGQKLLDQMCSSYLFSPTWREEKPDWGQRQSLLEGWIGA